MFGFFRSKEELEQDDVITKCNNDMAWYRTNQSLNAYYNELHNCGYSDSEIVITLNDLVSVHDKQHLAVGHKQQIVFKNGKFVLKK